MLYYSSIENLKKSSKKLSYMAFAQIFYQVFRRIIVLMPINISVVLHVLFSATILKQALTNMDLMKLPLTRIIVSLLNIMALL